MQNSTNISSTFSKYCTGYYGFAFNGQEKTDEVSGVGNHLDFKYRGYDPQTGRFWSVDPLFKEYPDNSSYAFCENSVIAFKELEGKEKIEAMLAGTYTNSKIGTPVCITVKYDFNTQIIQTAITVSDSKQGPISLVYTYNNNTKEQSVSYTSLPVPKKFFVTPPNSTTINSTIVGIVLSFTVTEKLAEMIDNMPKLVKEKLALDRNNSIDNASKLIQSFVQLIKEDKLVVKDIGKAQDEIKTIKDNNGNEKNVYYKSGDTFRIENTEQNKGAHYIDDSKITIEKIVVDYTDQKEQK